MRLVYSDKAGICDDDNRRIGPQVPKKADDYGAQMRASGIVEAS